MNIFECEELVRHLCDLDDDADLDDACYEQFEVDFPQFVKIVEALLPLATVGQSPLSGETYRGFAVEKDGAGRWLLKQKVTD